VSLYAIAGIVIAAIASIVGIKLRASSQVKKANAATATAEKKAADKTVEAVEAKAESVHHAGEVEKANTAVDAIDAARIESDRRARILEEHANVPKIDPADPRPGAARLRQVEAAAEALPGVHRDPGEGD